MLSLLSLQLLTEQFSFSSSFLLPLVLYIHLPPIYYIVYPHSSFSFLFSFLALLLVCLCLCPQRPCYFLCVSQEPWNSLQECESSKGAERQSWANHPSLPWTGAQTRGKEGECLFLLVGVCVHVVLNILSLRWIRHIRDKSLSRMGSTNLPCGGHSPLT